MRWLIFLGIMFMSTLTHAQQIKDTLHNGVVIEKDIRLALLETKKAEINKRAAEARKPISGFRVQVLNTTNRTEVLNAKSKLLALYPEHKTYLIYQSPYFKLRIGNFSERSEADKMRKELGKIFTTGVFIIPVDIESKSAEKEEKNK